MIKKLTASFLVICILLSSFGIVVFADISDVVVWSAAAYVDGKSDFSALTDQNPETVFSLKPLGASLTARLFFDLQGSNAETEPYNRVKVGFAKYNAMKLSVYTADSVYNALGSAAKPPASSGISSVKFQSSAYQNPAAVCNFTPYYVSLDGSEGYPSEIILPMNRTTDRFLCVEVTTAYDAVSSESIYYGIENALTDISVGLSVPASIEVTAEAEKVPVPTTGERQVAFSGKVKDEDGSPMADEVFMGFQWKLAESYTGVTLSNEGVLSIGANAVPGTEVTVQAISTADGYQNVTGEKTVTLFPQEEVEKSVSEVAELLTYDKISSQSIDATGKNLNLIYAKNGAVTIGDKTYTDIDIEWRSSKPDIISNQGEVKRPGGANAKVTLTAVISGSNSLGQTFTERKRFEITVIKAGELIDMKNLMAGGYGWVPNGWGSAGSAVDGKRSTYWALGNHSNGSIAAGLKMPSGNLEKYNKVVIYFWGGNDKIGGYSAIGYKTIAVDPGKNTSTSFSGGSGATNIVSYNPDDPATVPDSDGRVVVNLKKVAQSRGFGVTLTNIAASSNSFGIYEFEVYYATPDHVTLKEPGTVLFKPPFAENAVYSIPEMVVYDEAGDVLNSPFEHSIALAEDYPGISLENEKIVITPECDLEEISLLYKTWDESKVYLNEKITIPLLRYTEDYYAITDTIGELEKMIPKTVEGKIELPVSAENGCSITWSSDKPEVIAPDGTVNRPAYPERDIDVVLTAMISKGDYSLTKDFQISVIKEMTDEQRVIQDANRILIEGADTDGNVSQDLKLPNAGVYGSRIIWKSDNPSVISDTGKYNRIFASASSVAVTLTARVTYGESTITKDFTFYAKTTMNSGGGSGASGGSGGGGRGPSGGGIYIGSDDLQIKDGTKLEPLDEDELNAGRFVDVSNDYWAKDYIEKLAERKVVLGNENNFFEPERSITREEFTKMIVVAFDMTLKPGNTAFKDVETSAWYADYVVTAQKAGIINGISEDEFGIGKEITRQDMAVMIARVLRRANADFTGTAKQFADEAVIADYAKDDVISLSKIDIISGDENSNMNPVQNATRAEAAKMICTAMQKGGLTE